jgi:hypothetical protein
MSTSSDHIAVLLNSLLTDKPCTGGGRLEEVASLPTPQLEELQTCPEKGAYIVGAALLGDALTGTALLLADSDGRPHCFWPALQPGRVWNPGPFSLVFATLFPLLCGDVILRLHCTLYVVGFSDGHIK